MGVDDWELDVDEGNISSKLKLKGSCWTDVDGKGVGDSEGGGDGEEGGDGEGGGDGECDEMRPLIES